MRYSVPVVIGALVASLGAVPAQAATGDLTAGSFAWPIKKSFMEHLQGPIAAGTLVGSEGATFKDSQFVFPVNVAATQLDAQGNGTIALDGQASIVAYRGLGKGGSAGLDVRYSDLKIKVEGTHAQLIGDFAMAGDPGDKDQPVDGNGDDQVLVSFELEKPISVGHDSVNLDRVATAGPGVEASLLRYKTGQVLDDGDVDLILDYEDGKDPMGVTGYPLTGMAKLSAEVATLSSGKPSVTGVVTVVAAVAALLGGIGAIVAHSGFDLRAKLAELGVRI